MILEKNKEDDIFTNLYSEEELDSLSYEWYISRSSGRIFTNNGISLTDELHWNIDYSELEIRTYEINYDTRR